MLNKNITCYLLVFCRLIDQLVRRKTKLIQFDKNRRSKLIRFGPNRKDNKMSWMTCHGRLLQSLSLHKVLYVKRLPFTALLLGKIDKRDRITPA